MSETKFRSSSELLLPPRGAGVAFVRKEFERPPPAAARRTFRFERSSVLGRVRTLLPQLASAEDELQQRMEDGPTGLVDIENVGQNEPHIEMDLAVVPLPQEEMTHPYCSTSEDDESGEEEEEEDEEEGLKLRLPGEVKRSRTAGIEELPCH